LKILTTAIYGKLSGSALAAHVGNRLFKGRAPEGAEYPYIVYLLITDMPDYTFKNTLENVTIQFSLFSANPSTSEAEDMFTDLKTLYDDCTFSISASTLIWMIRQNAILMAEDHTVKDGTIQVWHYAVDYSIITERA